LKIGEGVFSTRPKVIVVKSADRESLGRKKFTPLQGLAFPTLAGIALGGGRHAQDYAETVRVLPPVTGHTVFA
jgi:hypothetical protein